MYGRAHIGGLYEVEEALGRGVLLPASEGVCGVLEAPIGVWGGAPGANAFLIHKITKTAYNLIF